MQRIGERTVLDPDDYACRGQTFAIPNRCKFFEVIKLPNDEAAAKIWNWCDPSAFLGNFHAELLGPAATARQKAGWPYFEIGGELCYYLVGYCPIRFFDDLPGFAVLDSLWIPGMDNTPEFAAFVRDKKPDTVSRMNFSKRVSRTKYADLYEHRDFDLIREIHAYVPQVKVITEHVFDYWDESF